MTVWLDHVLAEPAVGILTAPWFELPTQVWPAIARLDEAGKLRASQLNTPNATEVRIARADGSYLNVDMASATAGRSFNVQMEKRPGALPVSQPPPAAVPFAERLNAAVDDLCAFLVLGVGPGATRQLVRIGVVADCRMSMDEAPPGLHRYLHELGRTVSGSGGCPSGSVRLLSELRSAGAVRVQCHHQADWNDYEQPNELAFRLDWQQVWTPAKKMSCRSIEGLLRQAGEEALRYMESFGSGVAFGSDGESATGDGERHA